MFLEKHGLENHFGWNSFAGALQLLQLIMNKSPIK